MDRPITRRQALILGSGLVIGAATGCRTVHGFSSPRVARFRRTFQVPPVMRPVRTDATTDYYEVHLRDGFARIVPEARTPIWGFEGLYPGPTIHARRGRRVVVRQTNHLSVPAVVHLHGGVTTADSDGFPTDLIPPGSSRTYIYPNDQPAATLWYHDHAIHETGRNIYMGLAGLYLIRDEEEEALRLPSGSFDVPLLIQDRTVGPNGTLQYDRNSHLGARGDLVLVNGVPWPRMAVCARKYRFRVVNGANATDYRPALSSGRPLVQIATDLGLLPAPVENASIPLAMAERVEIIIDFSLYPVGTRIFLKNLATDGPHGDIMCFDVVCAERDPSELPDRLGTVERIPTSDAVRTREFVFSGRPAGFPPTARWTINGTGFDADHAIANPRLGDIEVWRFVNRRWLGILGMLHPVHVHLVRFQIVARNDGPPLPHETGWKDTVAISPGDDVRIIARFRPYRGRYLIHCHNLEHEDHDMMARYDVV